MRASKAMDKIGKKGMNRQKLKEEARGKERGGKNFASVCRICAFLVLIFYSTLREKKCNSDHIPVCLRVEEQNKVTSIHPKTAVIDQILFTSTHLNLPRVKF